MATQLQWRTFAAGRPFHAALVPLTEARSPGATHSHADFHELVAVVEGAGWHHLPGGRSQALSAGDLVLVRPHDTHEFTAGPGGCRLVNIAFASGRWQAFLAEAQVGAAAGWETADEPVVARAAGGVVAAAVDRALGEFQAEPRWLDLYRLWTAVVPVLETALAAPDARPVWLSAACLAMAGEDAVREGLPRLRRLAAVSEGHLARSTATWFGCTPVEYVNRLRLDHAATLLATTTEAVGTVAERSGFASHAYFCNRFHARFGTTPGEYRSRARRAVVP